VHVHGLVNGGPVFEDENVRVRAAVVDHPPVVPSFGYRFDAADRSIVISGDTKPSENLIELARGADVLVHEALYPAGVDRLVAGVPNALSLQQSILSHHTTAEDAGRVAKAAGVKTLVLSHFVPPDDATITDRMWIDAARKHFDGKIIVGKDLLEIQ
jgi:ribonuclease BN (tRNA processing enzyme)